MGWEHPPDMVFDAEDLYCLERLSYREIAERLGVAESTLKRWGDKHAWRSKREEIRQMQSEIRVDTVRLRSQRLKLGLSDPKTKAIDVFAIAKLEEVALKSEELARKHEKPAPVNPASLRKISSLADVAEALEEAVTLRLQGILDQPQFADFSAVKDIKQAFDLISKLKPVAAPASEPEAAPSKPAGLSLAVAEEIRNKILGIGQ